MSRKKKKVLLNIRVYVDDKKAFQDISYRLRDVMSQADLFSEMVKWIKENEDKLKIRHSSYIV